MIRILTVLLIAVCTSLLPGFSRAQTLLLKEGEILRGGFTQERYLAGFTKPVTSEGQFSLVPGQGLLWQAERPFAVSTVVTAKGIAQSIDGSETTRLAASRLPFLSRLYDMMAGALAGDLSSLEQEFLVSEERLGRLTHITLTPRRPDSPTAAAIKSLKIVMDRYVESVEIRKPGGDWDRLIFKNQTLKRGELSMPERSAFERAR